MAIIRVKKTPTSSFNAQRRASKLLLDQIASLEWAVLPAAKRKTRTRRSPTASKARRVKTEAQASARVAQLMALLLGAPEPAKIKPAAMTLPPMPRASKSRRPRKANKVKRAKNVKKVRKEAKRKTAKTATSPARRRSRQPQRSTKATARARKRGSSR